MSIRQAGDLLGKRHRPCEKSSLAQSGKNPEHQKHHFLQKARALGFSSEECRRLQSLYFPAEPLPFR